MLEQIGSGDVGVSGGGIFVAHFNTGYPSRITPFLPYNLIDITTNDYLQDFTIHFSAKPIYALLLNIPTTVAEDHSYSIEIKSDIVGNNLELSFDHVNLGTVNGTILVFFYHYPGVTPGDNGACF
ncbi:hypothetical protein FACS1894187_11280 [Synergistales bacterium]|nr:hypothetical protein FACS1894187_11280 [Synergistales bacterium]